MGLYNGNLGNYYSTPNVEPQGEYQFITITDIINNFMVAYVGEDKIIPRVSRADVRFHAARAHQELTYDTYRSHKTLELEIGPNLLLPIPHDYVNYVKLSWLDSAGNCRVITQCGSCPKDAISYAQDPITGNILTADGNGDIVGYNTITEGYWQDTTTIDSSKERTKEMLENGTFWYVQEYVDPVTEPIYSSADPLVEPSEVSNLNSVGGSKIEEEVAAGLLGQRYGMETSKANINGCFWINQTTGKIHFDSNLVGKTVIIQYISDGVATDGEMMIHKFAEEAVYKWIIYAIVSTRSVPDQRAPMFKKERSAAIRNAKIRLTNIKPSELIKVIRGKSKWIKH